MKYRWLGLFRAKAPLPSTDAYRTAPLVTDDDLVLVVPPVDDDVEAPPVMVRVGEQTLGPESIEQWSPRMKTLIVIAGIACTLMIWSVVFANRP